jgi:hypothetical protein
MSLPTVEEVLCNAISLMKAKMKAKTDNCSSVPTPRSSTAATSVGSTGRALRKALKSAREGEILGAVDSLQVSRSAWQDIVDKVRED